MGLRKGERLKERALIYSAFRPRTTFQLQRERAREREMKLWETETKLQSFWFNSLMIRSPQWRFLSWWLAGRSDRPNSFRSWKKEIVSTGCLSAAAAAKGWTKDEQQRTTTPTTTVLCNHIFLSRGAFPMLCQTAFAGGRKIAILRACPSLSMHYECLSWADIVTRWSQFNSSWPLSHK